MGNIPVKVPRDKNGEIDSDLVPKYSRTANGFDEKVISMYALGMSDKDIQEQIKETFAYELQKFRSAGYRYGSVLWLRQKSV